MKKCYRYLVIGFFVIFIVLIILISYKKQVVYNCSIFIDKKISEIGEINYVVYLITDKNIAIDQILSLKLEYKSGFVNLTNQILTYTNGLIEIKIININDIVYPNPQVIVYGQSISLLNYLLNSLY
ncbi:hypothetical protein [Spiroplasma culicicola]|uniref:Transmembrane protein n=1 Tax=Spiroplasma culicicola AES-1 TaxID=1276246 RepID=W6A865_9MOLU|nr:hypothetical protein [Spiroplasma culicicola]AHI53080.1 hypothetical protein SCULI_v1c07390 [Spiroplasma culicicola AES-1]